jgi:peptide-methionine (R)-S-oxide reductase
MNRRQLLLGVLCLFVCCLFLGCTKAEPKGFPLSKTKEEWKALLSNDSFQVLFNEVTEYPFSSELDKENRPGTYICAACHQPLFESTTKYDSGTGWPSFYDHIPGALEMKTDVGLLGIRTEYHCSRCGGHQGHVFSDGPGPTYKRFCNNGLALRFVPKGEKLPELRK